MMQADRDGRLSLSGRLASAEVAKLFRDSQSWREKGLPEVIDLAEVTSTDSSALALLLEWRSWAEQSGATIRFVNIPRSLCILASLSQIEGLLGWRTMDFESEGETGQCCG